MSITNRDDLLLTIEDGVATVTINRPQQRNAINDAMWRVIPELCDQLDRDPAVRVVVWRGAGSEAFSAGGDIGEFAWQRSNRAQAAAYNTRVDTALAQLLASGKPTIALITGFCMGGGFMLAAHCDIRIAASNARFGMPVARLGALITYAEMQRFVDIIGVSATTDLLLTGRMVNASEAQVIGLCTHVYPLDAIEQTVYEIARRMTQLSPLSQRDHKAMLQTLLRTPKLSDLSHDDLALADAIFDSSDYAEGTRAFLEKRDPRFSGE